ncbi:cobyrinic acid a,c-diamide synthase [Paenibacillus yonginensis]|uniref:Cobyrinic acid a,c-diamide synthase n=1 Tax=Paenibacillus yonginensis TaxID=1462996 RepID=A0A1B1MXY4_9BACL|nr:MinD/ParA family protein [Paenibacillus yonginensis]ANS74017.1 cobyrinic acid a,c-diamide synthase [Paenibacillus yonginensis]
MSDQAESLRAMIQSRALREKQDGPEVQAKSAKIITVSSGKGGVGKSNFTLNLALGLQALGKKVLLFDADIGMANIDVLMGVRPRYSLYHLLKGEKKISEIVEYGQNGLPFIAGGSGLADLFSLSEQDLEYFTSQIEAIAGEMDFILFDTGAGLSKETFNFITAADECLVVTTPEPTSITDAYALIKVVSSTRPDVKFRLVINRAEGEKEARFVADKITLVAERFLDLSIPLLGYIHDEPYVVNAVKRQIPFLVAYPHCSASKDIRQIAQAFAEDKQEVRQEGALTGIKGFLHKWLRTK